MRRYIFISTVIMLLLLLAGRSSVRGEIGQLDTLLLHYDLGEIREGNTYSHTFTIKNTFGRRFKVGRVRKNCGCLDVLLSKRDILPEEIFKATVKVKVTGRAYGSWEKETVILENSDNPKTIRLRLSGNFPKDGRMFAEPNEINVGSIPQTLVIERVFQIKRRDYSALLLESVESSSSSIVVQQSQKVLPDAGAAVFVLKINPTDLKIGPLKECIRIKTKHPNYKQTKINVCGEVIGDIYVIPKRLFLGRVCTQKSTSWSVELASFSNRKFYVISSKDTLGNNWTIISKGANLRLCYTPRKKNKKSGFIKGQITAVIRFDDTKERENITIPVIGIWGTQTINTDSNQLAKNKANVATNILDKTKSNR